MVEIHKIIHHQEITSNNNLNFMIMLINTQINTNSLNLKINNQNNKTINNTNENLNIST